MAKLVLKHVIKLCEMHNGNKRKAVLILPRRVEETSTTHLKILFQNSAVLLHSKIMLHLKNNPYKLQN